MEGATRRVISLLDLPVEIRRQVYDSVIPASRLVPFPLGDSEWSMKTNEARGAPPIIFACRKIYEETTPLFYSRAILEVAPAQQSNSYWDFQLEGKMVSHAYGRLIQTFRFYRPEHLRLIRKVHIFSNQSQAINGQCYEALLLWLIDNTSAEDIQISARPMTRISGKAIFDLPSWRATFLEPEPRTRENLRIVRIWTRKGRPPWEHEKMMRLRCKPSDGTLNPIQIYFCVNDKQNGMKDLQLDPRWLTKLSEEPEKVVVMEAAAPMIDCLMESVLQGKEAQDYKDNSRHLKGDAWLYQMVLAPT